MARSINYWFLSYSKRSSTAIQPIRLRITANRFDQPSASASAVQTAIEYEYRFAEYEYEEIQSEARSSYIPHRVERPPESASATASKLCFIMPMYVSAPEPTGPSASE